MMDNTFRLSQELAERRNLAEFCHRKKDGLRAFVASPNARERGHRSVVLIGSRAEGWSQAVVCQGGDHFERARTYADDYNTAPNAP